jgi:hypothetical protein
MRWSFLLFLSAVAMVVGARTPDATEPARLSSDAAVEDGGGDRPATPGQVIARHRIWQAFFDGCTRGQTNMEYLCACAATYALDKCEREAGGSDQAVAGCIERMDTDQAARECTSYGSLTTSGPVPPARVMTHGPLPPHLPRVPRLDRWNGSFQGCMRAATPQERMRAPSMAYTCACLATYIVNACAPQDDTTNDQVQRCIDVMGGDHLERVSVLCDGYGSVRMR